MNNEMLKLPESFAEIAEEDEMNITGGHADNALAMAANAGLLICVTMGLGVAMIGAATSLWKGTATEKDINDAVTTGQTYIDNVLQEGQKTLDHMMGK